MKQLSVTSTVLAVIAQHENTILQSKIWDIPGLGIHFF